MAKKLALGKGIASLIQETPNQILSQSLKSKKSSEDTSKALSEKIENSPFLIDVSLIETNPSQPRKIFKEKDLEELSESIKMNGIIQPLLVCKSGSKFELIAGERRLRAAKMAGLDKVPAIVKQGTDRDKMVMSIIENVQRSDLNCVEEALAYYNLMDDYKLSQEEVSKRVGKDRSTVANFLRILKLPRTVIESVQKELLSFGHAKVLAGLDDRQRTIELSEAAIAEKWSVRELEKQAKSNKKTRDKSNESDKSDKMLNLNLSNLKDQLEQKTGFHFDIKSKKPGKGQLVLKYSSEEEFNKIYEYLMK